MPKKIDFTLTKDELAAVQRAIKRDKRAEVRTRSTVVRMLAEGQNPVEVADLMSVTVPSIYGWWHRWEAGGIEGLANKPHKPRKRKADETYLQALDEALSKEPEAYGYSFAIWTRERLRDHLTEVTGVQMSVVWLGEVMKARGYVFRRPKHELTHLQDPAEKEAAKELLEELKKKSSQTISSSSLWTKRP
jgi:transposase